MIGPSASPFDSYISADVWPARDVLRVLTDFADDRLTRKDYDGHKHEQLRICVIRARQILAGSEIKAVEELNREIEQLTRGVHLCGKADMEAMRRDLATAKDIATRAVRALESAGSLSGVAAARARTLREELDIFDAEMSRRNG